MTTTEETKTIKDLTKTAKVTLLESIIEAAEGEPRAEALEALSRAYAFVAGAGPRTGEVTD